jgi:hypothetical protein
MSNDQDEKQYLNTVLSPENVREFQQVKAYLGIATNSDVIRYLIRQEFRRIAQADPQPVGAGFKPAPQTRP